MRRTSRSTHTTKTAVGALLATLTLGAVPAALAQRPHHARKPPPRSGTRVLARPTALGTILTDGRGFTLYTFSRDSKNRDACIAFRGCLTVWPALNARGRLVAGRGVKASKLGSIPLRHGVRQVTYFGHPLYRYVADSTAGETSYVGIVQSGGRWDAITPAGRAVK